MALNLDVHELPGSVPKPIDTMRSRPIIKETLKDLYFATTFRHNLGWKHAFVKANRVLKASDQLAIRPAFITITKNPYSWLLSLYKRPYHQYKKKEHRPDFETFIASPWKTVGREDLHPV
ncbi:MAG: hypothetical protein AAGC54_15255, partial [Cyanobacteria bacterium P01_F01_bin.4]